MTRRARCGARPRPARPSCVALSWALDAEANGTDFPSGTEEASQCVFSVCVGGGAVERGRLEASASCRGCQDRGYVWGEAGGVLIAPGIWCVEAPGDRDERAVLGSTVPRRRRHGTGGRSSSGREARGPACGGAERPHPAGA